MKPNNVPGAGENPGRSQDPGKIGGSTQARFQERPAAGLTSAELFGTGWEPPACEMLPF